MSEEDPKSIWITDEDYEFFHAKPNYSKSTQYIRADIVEEMREALEEVLLAERFSNRPPVTVYQAEEKLDRIKQAVIRAEAALKLLEEP